MAMARAIFEVPVRRKTFFASEGILFSTTAVAKPLPSTIRTPNFGYFCLNSSPFPLSCSAWRGNRGKNAQFSWWFRIIHTLKCNLRIPKNSTNLNFCTPAVLFQLITFLTWNRGHVHEIFLLLFIFGTFYHATFNLYHAIKLLIWFSLHEL